MSVLDWTFIVLLSSAILLLLCGFLCLFLKMKYSRTYRLLQKKQPKNKKKRKKWRQHRRQLQKKAQKSLRNMVLLFTFGLLFFVASFYARYYQLTHLNAADGEIIVQTYFLVDSIEKDLISIQNGAKPVGLKDKFHSMTAMLVSYGSQPPSTGLSTAGQQRLSKYYANTKEFGMNLNSQTIESLEKKETIANYLEDTKKLKNSQKVIFKQKYTSLVKIS